MTEGRYPQWPGVSWPTKAEAITQAVADSDPGDEVVAHEATCALKWNEDCSCNPTVIVVREGRA